jgi:predicted HD superfamily hydrolase involved in NAD metabolism
MPLTIEAAERALSERLSPRSLAHSQRVAAYARRLAEVHGVDPDLAELAGLLHDWARDESDASLLDSAARRDLAVCDVDRMRPYLLHSSCGARMVEAEFDGIPAAVVRAIERHTVGARDMTPLDQVVFLADMLEPGRPEPALERLRDEAETGELAEAFFNAYAQSVARVVRSGQPLHPETVAVWNALVESRNDG